MATGPLAVTGDVAIGTDYWGLSGDLNLRAASRGVFASVGGGTVRFVTEPKESRTTFGGTAGWERSNRDMIICPYLHAGSTRGSAVYAGTDSTYKRSGNNVGLGVGIGFELRTRKKWLSYNPFLSGAYTRLYQKIDRTTPIDTVEYGVFFAAGLGVRVNEYLQITPSFSGGTFEGSNLEFDLRVSLALRFKKG
ncbi:MAG TPA: hypothetical protein VE967_14175 [Gemmatimonadaceae bacterium]|nr:hypothetical protein [Gemmatimonadaceae bacterium]